MVSRQTGSSNHCLHRVREARSGRENHEKLRGGTSRRVRPTLGLGRHDERGHHMNIIEDSNLGGWKGTTLFRGSQVEFSIDAEMWNADPQEVAEESFRTIERRWSEIEGCLLTKPYQLYHGSWLDPQNGFHALSKREFLAKITLQTLAIGEGSITAYFTDGNLFSGHSISVCLIGEEEPQAMLEG